MTTFTSPHRRYNPLTDEWILVSPQRATRPWLGAVEKAQQARRPEYDPKCYLCPGNTRAVGATNPQYESVYVFDNDFPALLTSGGTEEQGREGDIPSPLHPSAHLLRSQQETGVCRVICFSPRHDLTLAELPVEDIRAVVDTWVAQCEELGARDDITYIQLFENKGEIMGCSNPHPHGQLWATRHVPTEIAKETRSQWNYLFGGRDKVTGRQGDKEIHPVTLSPSHPLLIDYLQLEQKDGTRILFENEHFVCLVPFWATWPFETMVLPKRHIKRIVELSDARTRCAGRCDEAHDRALRQSVRGELPLHDGCASSALRWRTARRMADALALLSAAVAQRYRKEVHGRLRDAGPTTARPDGGAGGGAVAGVE